MARGPSQSATTRFTGWLQQYRFESTQRESSATGWPSTTLLHCAHLSILLKGIGFAGPGAMPRGVWGFSAPVSRVVGTPFLAVPRARIPLARRQADDPPRFHLAPLPTATFLGHPEQPGRAGEVEPGFKAAGIGFEYRILAVGPQCRGALPGPAVAVSAGKTVPVQNARDDIVAGNPRKLANSLDNIQRCPVNGVTRRPRW